MPEGGRPAPAPSPRTIAAFDFDRTLSTRDNVLPFLRSVAGPWRVKAALIVAAPDLVRAAAGDRSRRDFAKATVVRRVLAGRDATTVEVQGRRFAEGIAAAHLRADVVERAAWHRDCGHELVIVSASLGTYLRPVAEALGFDAVLATELEVGADGALTGGLAGANVRGPEKVRRLDAWLHGAHAVVWAYGDGPDDRELLARADHAVMVGRDPLIRAATIRDREARDGHYP
jgi:phosphatidylglycerophosphatase C